MADNPFDQFDTSQPDTSAVSAALLGQESGNKANASTSIDGAVGRAQIMPETFAQYALPGERIDNDADNLAVHKRIVDDLHQKAGGDPARVAVGYFSGAGNIAPPDSPTPWKQNHADGNGKRVSSYVSDVLGRMGNAVVPSAQASESKPQEANPFDQFDAPAAQGAAANPFDQFDAAPTQVAAPAQPKPNATADVGKTLIGNVAPNAIANTAANLVSVPYTVGSYAAQIGTKAGEILGKHLPDNMQQAIANGVETMGLRPFVEKYGDQDLSQYIPTPSTLLNAGMNAMGTPLYQPKTEAGKQTAMFGNIATGGIGSGASAMSSLMGAAGATGLSSAAKQVGASDDVQFLASLAGGLGGGAMGSRPAVESPDFDNQAGTTLGTKTPETPSYTSEDLRAMAKPAYDAVTAKGGLMTPEFTNSFLDDAKEAITEPESVTKAFGNTAAQRTLGGLEETYRDKPMTLDEATAIDKRFSQALDSSDSINPKTGKLTEVGKQIYDMQSSFRDKLESAADNGQVAGDTGGIDAWQQARQLWAQSVRVGDIERIIQRGMSMDNPATSIRSGFRTLYNNPVRMRGYTPEQQALIKDAGTASLSQEALRVIGSRLTSIGSVLAGGALGGIDGGVVGGLASTALGAGARKLAGNMQAGQAQKVIDSITANARPYTPQEAAPQAAPLQLAAPTNEPIAMPEDAIRPTYNPADLNVTGDVSVPEVKQDVLPPRVEPSVKPWPDYATTEAAIKEALAKELPSLQNQYMTGKSNASTGKAPRAKANTGKNVQGNE